MWPFTSKTLYDRYSKLMKLLMSIDSHFEVTENKRDSVRLHLPNYKGNQPMDFHIYLIEPFLFISFTIEVEGKKISSTNSYPQEMNQQDLFNAAMASNLEKIHESVEETVQEEVERGVDLNEEQQYSLYYYADLCYNSCTKKSGAKQSTLFNLFLSRLKLSEENIIYLKAKHSSAKPEELYRALKSIDDKDLLNLFISTCVVFVDDADTFFIEKALCDMLQAIGLSVDDVRNIVERKGLASTTHFYDRERTTAWDEVYKKDDTADIWIDEYGAEYGKDKKLLIHVPSEIKDYSVLEGTEVIGDYAFENTEAEDIEYDEIVKSGNDIWDYIRSTSELVSVTIPNSIMTIGENIFEGCNKLTAIHIPEGSKKMFEQLLPEYKDLLIESFSTYLLKDASKDSWSDESGVTYSKDNKYLLSGNRLKEYDIRQGTQIICDHAFEAMFDSACLEKIGIPDTVRAIGYSAFFNCAFEDIYLPDSIEYIGVNAFENCFCLRKAILPNSVKVIDNEAFIDCSNLKYVYLPASLRVIGDDVFSGCDSLQNIYVVKGSKARFEKLLPGLADKITELDVKVDEGFRDMFKTLEEDWWADENGNHYIIDYMPVPSNPVDEELHNPIIDKSNPERASEEDLSGSFTDEYGVKYSSDMKILKRAPHEIIDYPILDGTEIISDASFSNCENLVSVTIPRSIKTIGHYAFAGCKKIFSIIIPEGIDSIGDGSFMNCETLKTLRLPASLISISDDAFEGCNNLNTIFVPEEEKIRFEAMLSKFDVNIAVYNSNNVSALDELLTGLLDESGVLYSKDGKVVFTHTKELSKYSVKEGTEFINNKAFSPIEGVDANLFSLKEIYLPDSVVTIGEQAFANNEGLQEITLPTSIKSIGKDAFRGCKSLNIIRIPYGTGAKFEILLPEWKDKLVEKYKEVIDTLYGFELPDGSLYNGSCIRKPFGTIELDGIGSISYPNGDKYKGNFKYGRPYGWGIYWFANGHKHKGYFDNQPRGIGYLNEDYNMAVGNFFEGRLHGWAICYRNRVFKFGFWENGKLVLDETDKTLWVRCEISNLRAQYHSNLVQISQGHELIRFGIPERTINTGVKTPNSPKWPAVGFEFYKDGTVKVGEIKNNASGNYILCKNDRTMEIGHWKENVKDVEKTLIDFQGSVGIYEVDGLDVYKNESSSHTCYPDDYYLKKYSKTREEYFRENYNEVSCLTAKCLRNKSESWVHEDYSELEIGKTYKVTHIGVFRSFTCIMLEGFGDKEYNSVCFEIFEDGKSIDKRYTKDVRFWAPYLRDRLEGKSEND